MDIKRELLVKYLRELITITAYLSQNNKHKLYKRKRSRSARIHEGSSEKLQRPAGIYLFKFNNGNTRAMCEICSKLTIKTPERCQ